jgi:hypothetical protein
LYWLGEIGVGSVPGPVDPFLKTLQGYSLYISHFHDQSLFYSLRELDQNYEFCFFQKDIFTFRLGDSLLGPFPISLTSIVAILFNFLDFKSVHLFFTFLNFILYWIILRNVKEYFSIAFLVFFGLPFFIPNSEVSEHALLILTQIAGFYFLKQAIYRERNNLKKNFNLLLLAGVILGSGLFLRHEVLIFANFLIATAFMFKFIGHNRTQISWKGIFLFTIGIYISFAVFFIMNKLMYGSSVGPRLNTNNSGLYSDIGSKLSFFKVILWKEGPYLGLFGKNPFFLITLMITIFFHKKWTFIDKLCLFPSLGLMLVVPILAPNDGGSPWGARYLFLCIFPLIYLTARSYWWIQNNGFGKILVFLQILMTLSILQSMNIERKSLIAAKDVAKQQNKYMHETAIDDADLIIFTSELVAMQTGINYIKYPVVLLNHEDNLPSFQSKFLNNKQRFKKIVLIEPVTENLNLSKFSKTDLAGIKPDFIIKNLDRILQKVSIEKKDLTIVHRYINK